MYLIRVMIGLTQLLAMAVKGVAYLVVRGIVYPAVVVVARLARGAAGPLRTVLKCIGYTFVAGHLRRLP